MSLSLTMVTMKNASSVAQDVPVSPNHEDVAGRLKRGWTISTTQAKALATSQGFINGPWGDVDSTTFNTHIVAIEAQTAATPDLKYGDWIAALQPGGVKGID